MNFSRKLNKRSRPPQWRIRSCVVAVCRPLRLRSRRQPPPAKVTCHFEAEMEGEVELKETASVSVTISREIIAAATKTVSASAAAEVDPTRKLIVQLLAKTNFDAVGETRVELDLPAPNEPASLYFDVEPTNEGEGEIWIVIRQGQVPLVNLILRPRIAARRSANPHRIKAPATTTEAPALAEPLHQLRIFERRKGNELSYQFIFDSPSLNLSSLYESPPITGDRSAYINQLYKEIENRWIGNGEDALAFNEDLRAFGAELWDQLFPAALQAELWQHRDVIRSIMVFSEEPFIPWELVHMKEPGKRLDAEPIVPRAKRPRALAAQLRLAAAEVCAPPLPLRHSELSASGIRAARDTNRALVSRDETRRHRGHAAT